MFKGIAGKFVGLICSVYATALPAAAQPITASKYPFQLSHQRIDFGTVYQGSRTVVSVVLRPTLSGAAVGSAALTKATQGLRLLSVDEIVARGGRPCTAATVSRFCVIEIELDGYKPGAPVSASLDIKMMRNGTPSLSYAFPSISVTGSIGGGRDSSSFETVSLRQAAAKAGYTNIQQYLKANLMRVAPTEWTYDDLNVFSYINPSGPSVYQSTWFNSVLNSSGHAWDRWEDGTAISPHHVVFASHFPRSGPITFHDMNGEPFTTTITDLAAVPGTDITVGRIEPGFPKNWTIYSLPDASEGFGNENSDELLNAPIITHRYAFNSPVRRSIIRKIVINNYYEVREASADAEYSWYFSLNAGQGDSGNPSFLWVGDRLVLLSHCSAGVLTCSGPNYASRAVQNGLKVAIEQLG